MDEYEQKPIAQAEPDQAALHLQVVADTTKALTVTMRAVQGMMENMQEERHEQRAITQQLIAESQQTREELRQNRELQVKLLEALQARQAPAQPAPSQADNAQGAAGHMPAPAASGGAMHAPAAGGAAAAAGGAAAAAGDAAAEEDGAAVVLPGEGIVKYRLKSHVFSHYVDGQLYREPRLHLRTLRRLTPKLAAMKKPGGKVSWAILNQAGIPFEQWPVMLSKRGDRVWMSLIQARKVANI